MCLEYGRNEWHWVGGITWRRRLAWREEYAGALKRLNPRGHDIKTGRFLDEELRHAMGPTRTSYTFDEFLLVISECK